MRLHPKCEQKKEDECGCALRPHMTEFEDVLMAVNGGEEDNNDVAKSREELRQELKENQKNQKERASLRVPAWRRLRGGECSSREDAALMWSPCKGCPFSQRCL